MKAPREELIQLSNEEEIMALESQIAELVEHATMLLKDLEQDFTYTANELQSAYCLRTIVDELKQ